MGSDRPAACFYKALPTMEVLKGTVSLEMTTNWWGKLDLLVENTFRFLSFCSWTDELVNFRVISSKSFGLFLSGGQLGLHSLHVCLGQQVLARGFTMLVLLQAASSYW